MTPIALSSLFATGRPADRVVAVRDGTTCDFDRFSADANGVIARAAALPHKRAALVCRGSYAFTVGLLGLLHSNCEIVLPPNSQPGTLASLGDHFDFLVDDDFVQGCMTTHDHRLNPLDAIRPCLTFFTSGSTGAPKRIEKSLAMLEREIAALDRLWGDATGRGTVFATVPHQHIYGLTFKILWPLTTGRPFADETDELWENLLTKLTADSTLVSGPAHLSRIAGLDPLPLSRRPSRIFSAGAPLSQSAAREAEAILGRLPTEIFGSTETGAIATREQSQADQPWRLLPGNAMSQSDDGRLKLLSPWVSQDWFETADVIAPIPGGFRLLGRADRIVKIEGKRISLPEIEQSLSRLPWITAVAAIVLPAPAARLAAAVVLNDDGRQKLAQLGRFRFGRLLRKSLSETQDAAGMPRLWRFVDDLPSPDGMGKRRDNDIRALFGRDS